MSKKLCSAICFFFCFYLGNAQIVNIPDQAFLKELIEDGIDLNGDSLIQQTEASEVLSLDLNSKEIKSLQGLKSFDQASIMILYSDSINIVDLSQNPSLTNLTFFCENLEEMFLGTTNLISLSVHKSGLTSLDLSSCTQLNGLIIDETPIKELDLSGLTKLRFITISDCLVEELDLSDQTDIYSLYLGGTPIAELDLSRLSELNALHIERTDIISMEDIQFHTEARLINLRFGNEDASKVGFAAIDFTQAQYSDLRNLTYRDKTNVEFSFEGLNNISYVAYEGNLQTLDLNTNSSLRTLVFIGESTTKEILINNGSIEEVGFSRYKNSNLETICCDFNQIDAIAALTDSLQIDGHIISYCGFNEYENRSTLEGTFDISAFQDLCQGNASSDNRHKLKIRKGNVSTSYVPNLEGDFKIALSVGEYKVVPEVRNNYFDASPLSSVFNIETNDTNIVQDYKLIPNGEYQDIEVFMAPMGISQPGFETSYKLRVRNRGTVCVSGQVELNYDSAYSNLLSTSPLASNPQSGSLIWDYTELGPFKSLDYLVTLTHNGPMDSPSLNGGDELTFILSDSNLDQDQTPEDNYFILKDRFVNSFDPNDIICLEGASIPKSKIGDYVHYKIRFENTGTAVARNVVVQDSIDLSRFEYESLEIMDASHSVDLRLLKEGSAEFIFADIDLPFDDENNDGYLVFKIRTFDTLSLGDTLPARASIYFDFNFPIVTEKYVTEIVDSDLDEDGFAVHDDCDDADPNINPIAEDIPGNGIDEDCNGEDAEINDLNELENSTLEIFPNPTKDFIYFRSNNENDNFEASLYDIRGAKISTINNRDRMPIASFPAGIYFLKCVLSSGKTDLRRVIIY